MNTAEIEELLQHSLEKCPGESWSPEEFLATLQNIIAGKERRFSGPEGIVATEMCVALGILAPMERDRREKRSLPTAGQHYTATSSAVEEAIRDAFIDEHGTLHVRHSG